MYICLSISWHVQTNWDIVLFLTEDCAGIRTSSFTWMKPMGKRATRAQKSRFLVRRPHDNSDAAVLSWVYVPSGVCHVDNCTARWPVIWSDDSSSTARPSPSCRHAISLPRTSTHTDTHSCCKRVTGWTDLSSYSVCMVAEWLPWPGYTSRLRLNWSYCWDSLCPHPLRIHMQQK